MITLTWVYILAGAAFAAFAIFNLADTSNSRRFGNAAFWGLMAASMWAGDYLGDFGNGLLVLALVAIAGFGGLGKTKSGDIAETTKQERASRIWAGRLALSLRKASARPMIGTWGMSTGSAKPEFSTAISDVVAC